MAIKIIKAKDRKPSQYELVFEWLTGEPSRRAKGFSVHHDRIYLAAIDNGNGTYTATAFYLSGRSIFGSENMVFTKAECISWLSNCLAEIPKPSKPSEYAKAGQWLRRAAKDVQNQRMSEIQAFLA